jgi:hypothetical protein
MAALGELASVAEPLLRYRRRPDSVSGRDAARTTEASGAVSADAIERLVGHRPPARIIAGLRRDGPTLRSEDAREVLDVVLPVYGAIRAACRQRAIPTGSLPGQVLSLLDRGGVRTTDGSWSPAIRSYALTRHPGASCALLGDAVSRFSARRRRAR